MAKVVPAPEMRQSSFLPLLRRRLLQLSALATALGSFSESFSFSPSCRRVVSTARSSYRSSRVEQSGSWDDDSRFYSPGFKNRQRQSGGWEDHGGIAAPVERRKNPWFEDSSRAGRRWKDERRGSGNMQTREWRQPMQAQRGGSSKLSKKLTTMMSPMVLTSVIQEADTDKGLMQVLKKAMLLSASSLNGIHVTAAFCKLAKMQKPLNVSVLRSPTLTDLVVHTERTIDRRELRGRQIAQLLASVASLRQELPGIAARIGPDLLVLVSEYADEMNPQELTKTLWGLAGMKFEEKDEVMVDKAVTAASQECLKHLPFFSVWDLPRIAVSHVKLGIWNTNLMDAIARRLSPDLQNLEYWSLADLAWCWKQPISPWSKSGGLALKQGAESNNDDILESFLSMVEGQLKKTQKKSGKTTNSAGR